GQQSHRSQGLDEERNNSHTGEYCTETNIDPGSSCNISFEEKQSSETVVYETHRQRHPNDRNDENCRVQGTIFDESDPLLLRGLVTPNFAYGSGTQCRPPKGQIVKLEPRRVETLTTLPGRPIDCFCRF